jgi:hypothetical protein
MREPSCPDPEDWRGERLHPARAPGSRQQSRCESSALQHRKPIAACLRGSVVGWFRRLGPTMRCSRRRGSPSPSQAALSGAADLVSLEVKNGPCRKSSSMGLVSVRICGNGVRRGINDFGLAYGAVCTVNACPSGGGEGQQASQCLCRP